METKIINEIIEKKTNSSKMFKIIGEYIIENTTEIPFLNLQELSFKSGVSTATIVRFCKSLGFDGYSEFQTNLKNYLKNEIIPTREFKESIDNDKEAVEVVMNIIETNIKMLEVLKKEINFNDLEEIVEMLHNASKIYIIGNRLSYPFAYYFYYLLKEICKNVEIIIPEKEDYTHKLLYVESTDLVFSICFYPYVKFTYDVTNYLKKQGCKIISLTDVQKSPFVEISHKVLYAYNNANSYSFISAMTTLNFILALYGKKNKSNFLGQIQKLKKLSEELDIYFK